MTGRRGAFLFGVAFALPCAALGASPASELAKQVRSAALDPEQCYRVRDLSLAKEDLKLYLTEGYLIFSKPVNGERVSAVFSTDVEGGDGEVLLLPPFRGERLSLSRFAKSPNLDEHVRAAALVFSDGSAQELLDAIARGGGRKDIGMGALLAEQGTPVLAGLEAGFELRLVEDLMTPPAKRRGLFFASLAGKTLGTFDAFYDGQSESQITVGRLAQREGHAAYDIWTSFPARSLRNGTAKPPENPVTEQSFKIDAALDPDLNLRATVRVSLSTGPAQLRTLAFAVAHAIEVSSVRVDGEPAELQFAPAFYGGAPDTDNGSFLVIPAKDLAAGQHLVEFEEHGSIISPAGNDVYFVGARANWYPRAGLGLATYDLTFRYPKRLTLVTPGDVTDDHADGDFRVTRRVTATPIRIAGFNLGQYQQATGLPEAEKASGVHVEVYGNRRIEAALEPWPQPAAAATIPGPRAGRGARSGGALADPPVGAPMAAPDPLARLQEVAADVASAVHFYSGLFGPPALKTLTVSPIPGSFGQGFPGLVYLSTVSYLDPAQRPEGERDARAQTFFSDLIEAHEVAHQWWGNIVLPAGYQDDWLPEALASYSALMYMEKKKGVKAMEDVLEDYRDSLIRRDGKGATTESAGPIAWGFRLDATGNAAARHDITYYKGAWVLHMLRRRMGDAAFLKMLAELRRRYDSRTLSTAQFAALVKEFAPGRMPGAGVLNAAFNADSFFENWVYSTGIPELKLDYLVKGIAPSVKLSGTVEQSGVDDDFFVEIPVELQFASGAPQTIWVQTSNDGAVFSATLKQIPVKVSIPAGRGVLAVKK